MGAWGFKSFDNDDAADWVYAFEEQGAVLITETLKAATAEEEDDDYLDASVCCEALAAAEVVAAVKTGDHSHLSEEAEAALKSKADGIATPEVVALALDAVKRVRAESELRDLWEESEDFEAWQKDVEALEKRLG